MGLPGPSRAAPNKALRVSARDVAVAVGAVAGAIEAAVAAVEEGAAVRRRDRAKTLTLPRLLSYRGSPCRQ